MNPLFRALLLRTSAGRRKKSASRKADAYRRRPLFEHLELRQLFAGDVVTSIAAVYGSAVTTTTSGSVTTTTSTTSASSAAALSVNAFDLQAAMEAGLRHLQNLIDPATGLPYFAVWSMTTGQAAGYGDSQSGRPAAASMVIDQHMISNVAGRALYALMLGSDTFGIDVSASVLSALQSVVLKSLNKPRNGNWNDTSAANQMVTGLASDPRVIGSKIYDMTYLFNMGAGMRGALALATLLDDPNAILPGYGRSAESLFEVAVYNIRKYYVYGGNEIGGTRTYNWETFRKTLGLTGGDVWGSGSSGEIVSNWSNIYKNYADPFLIDDLVNYYEETGSQTALALAKELADYAFSKRFSANPASQFASFTHSFEIMGEMNAYSRLALATGDANMMNLVRARYESLRGVGFSSTGWVPEWFHKGSDAGEVNSTVELIETALNFAKFGWTEYYGDVERFTRGGLLPTQLLDTRFVQANSKPANDGQRDLANRLVGAFGFAAPYGVVATKSPSQTGAYHTDVTAGAVAGLAEIQKASYAYVDGVHQINLLFDQTNDKISLATPYAGGDKLTITTKVGGDVRLRLPTGTDRTVVSASLAAQGLTFRYEGEYLRIVSPPVNTAISFTLPLAVQRTTDTVNGRQIKISWRGDSVAAMSRMGTPLPFFADIDAPAVTPTSPPAPGGAAAPLAFSMTVDAGVDLNAIVGQATPISASVTVNGGKVVTPTVVVAWVRMSGPGDVVFDHAGALSATAKFSQAGDYVLRLVSTKGTATSYDEVKIHVDAAPNAVPAAPLDLVFQDLGSYAGTRDTTIMAPVVGKTAVAQRSDVVTVDGTTDRAGLIAWDIRSIAVGTVIMSVSIELNIVDPTQKDFEIYAAGRAWNEAEANWKSPAAGKVWSVAGATGTGDKASGVLGVLAPRSNGTYRLELNAAGIAVVQNWINNPASNNGFIIQDYAAADAVSFSSSEATDPAARPKLIISYLPQLPASVGPFLVNAGGDQTVGKNDLTVLFGSVAGTTAPPAMTLKWTLTSGPAPVTIANSETAVTRITFTTPGIYILRLTGTSAAFSAYDEVTIFVTPDLTTMS